MTTTTAPTVHETNSQVPKVPIQLGRSLTHRYDSSARAVKPSVTTAHATIRRIATTRCTRSLGRRRTLPLGTTPKNDGAQCSGATAASTHDDAARSAGAGGLGPVDHRGEA